MTDNYPSAFSIVELTNSFNNKQEFTEAMSRQHRTHQQQFTSSCFAWIEHLSKLGEGEYDARNEASVHFAKRIVDRFNKDEPYEEFQFLKNLPLI